MFDKILQAVLRFFGKEKHQNHLQKKIMNPLKHLKE